MDRAIINEIDRSPIHPNSVIVYDIDDTLMTPNGVPIWPILNTYNYAKRKGLTPVLITARPSTDENIVYTRRQLERAGIRGYACIYFRPVERQDVTRYKRMARRDLHNRGYHVIASVGDTPWDIGDYGGKGFLLKR